MSEEESELILQRILVALDASPHSLAALEAAVELAARARAELLGVFVEDANLLRLAELPFTRELGFYSTTTRPLNRLELERQLRAQARRAHHALAAMADRAQVRWSFRVARGLISAELLAATMEVDLITLGKVGWSMAGRRRVGSTARVIMTQASRPALVLQHGAHLALPAVVVYSDSPLAYRALAAAARLARRPDGDVLVLIVADEPDEAERLEAEASAQLGAWGIQARFRRLTAGAVLRLAELVRAEGGGTLVLPAETSLLQDEVLLALMEELDLPVLLVR